MLFQIDDSDRFESAYADLLERMQNALQQTYHEEQDAHGLTKTAIADALGVDLSVVSRRLNGAGNVTLRTISDTYTAMNREPLSNFVPPRAPVEENHGAELNSVESRRNTKTLREGVATDPKMSDLITRCKICEKPAPLDGVVDFSKSCEENRGLRFPLLGIPVWYHRCGECGFLFTEQFDGWSPEDWRREVYNDGYAEVDPDFASARPEGNARLVANVARQMGLHRVLDYGGGAGKMAAILRHDGIDAISWDTFGADSRPLGDFDLISCFEVFEHTTTPRETLADLVSFLRPGGAVLLSTWTDVPNCSHWYVAPRNGHVSIHSERSLALLFGDQWSGQKIMTGFYFMRRSGASL